MLPRSGLLNTRMPVTEASIRERACRLRHIISSSNRMDRRNLWDPWLKTHPLFVIQGARQYVDSKGLHPNSIRQSIAGNAAQSCSPAVLRRIRNRFQSTITKNCANLPLMIHNTGCDTNSHDGVFRTARPPMPTGFCADFRLSELRFPRESQLQFYEPSGTVGPRSAASNARARHAFSDAPRTLLTVSNTMRVALSSAIRRAARQHLRIQLRDWPYALTDFLMATGPPSAPHPTEDYIARSAILLYAAYSATNAARHRPLADSNESSAMLHQATYT